MDRFTRILLSGQLATLKQDLPAWLGKKINKGFLQGFIEPYDFELVEDGVSWLRSGSLSLCITNSAINSKSGALAIEVPTNKTHQERCKEISTKSCHILRNHLKTTYGIDYHFHDIFKYKYQAWEAKAQEWLINDVQQENDWEACFSIEQQEGKKIAIATPKKHFTLELDLYFNSDGCIEIDKLMIEVVKWFENSMGIQGLLDNLKQEKIRPLLSTATVGAIREENFTHPYQKGTKTQVLEIKDGIKKAAQKLKLDELALAGALADLLEIDTTFNVKKFYDTLGEWIWQGAKNFIRKGDETFVALLDTTAQSDPRMALPASLIKLVWTLLPRSIKEDSVASISRDLSKLGLCIFEKTAIASTYNRDRFAGIQAKIDLQELVQSDKVSPEKLKQLRSTVKAFAFAEMPAKTLLAFRVYFYLSENERLVNKSFQIAAKLNKINPAPDQRSRIYKWERFYGYFK